MGLKVYGLAACENFDNVGEKILIEGLNIDHLRIIKDEHPDQDNFFHIVGSIKVAKKIFKEADCEDDKQKRCWNSVKVPFVYIEGELADDENHPNAQSAAAILRFSQREDIPLNVGFSIDGAIVSRETVGGQQTEDKEIGKILARTIGGAASLTVKPCNPKCKAFLENDLAKSVAALPIPQVVLEALKKSESKSSFVETDSYKWKLLLKLQKLKKSLEDYAAGFTEVKCAKCGKSMRFFKSGDVPNGCFSCGKAYSLTQLWKALNK
jgi:ribosomal protein S27E